MEAKCLKWHVIGTCIVDHLFQQNRLKEEGNLLELGSLMGSSITLGSSLGQLADTR
jgi:hypothetical protein